MAGCGPGDAPPSALRNAEPERLARLAIDARGGDDRAVFMADGRDAFYYDALIGEQTREAMGFISGGFRMVDGWRWWFPEDSVGLGPDAITKGFVRPDYAARTYVEADTLAWVARLMRRIQGPTYKRFTEVVTLADGALLITISDSVGVVDFFPAFSDRPADGYTAQRAGGALVIARRNYMEARPDNPRPVWLAVAATDGTPQVENVNLVQRFPLATGVRERILSPGRIRFQTPGTVVLATGNTPDEAAGRARRAAEQPGALLQRRQGQMAAALEGNSIRTEDEDFNRAFDWARITLEQMIVEDGAGIDFSHGIPGVAAQPGWNSMLAFEGAFLATGQWERAANMLRHFARHQRFDQRIDIFGRAPSRFEYGQPRYQTADAQAHLVGAIGDYLRTTGDVNLVLGERRLFWTNPVYVQRGYSDPRQLRTEDGFIRNQPNQTWVQQPAGRRDAVDRGPESVEVQARYYHNLHTMERLARIMGVRRWAEDYRTEQQEFRQRFQRAFLTEENGPRLVDFRDAQRQADTTPRPSALFALRYVDLDPETERRVLRHLAETLVYPHGVSTRPQGEAAFYPYLEDPEYFQAAAARYDGPVWTVFSGPLISLLVEHGAADRAYEQFSNLKRLLLDRGVVGGIAENIDAHPRQTETGNAEPAVGGAPVQPFTLAEFIRTAYQDFVGVRYLEGHDVVLEPHLPANWGRTTATFRVGNGVVRTTMRQRGGELEVSLVPQGQLPRNARVRVRAFGQEQRIPLTRAGENGAFPVDSTAITITAERVTLNGEAVQPDSTYQPPDPAFWEDFAWAQPEIPEEYPVMVRVRDERQLSAEQVSRTNPNAVTILARTDPVGNDWGPTGTYTYPLGFPPRVLDATYLEIAEDRQAFYFRIEMAAMASPGEFGFQPTFIAVAFSIEEGGQTRVGRGANYRFAETTGYEYIVYIGDGLRVEDHQGRVLGEFPQLGDQIMDIENARIQFSLPKFVLSRLPRGATVTLLVGANEGGQPGQFRRVDARATERYGGGRLNPGDPNVYDVITARVGM
jgi:glycogen debranching enzyme